MMVWFGVDGWVWRARNVQARHGLVWRSWSGMDRRVEARQVMAVKVRIGLIRRVMAVKEGLGTDWYGKSWRCGHGADWLAVLWSGESRRSR